MTVAKERVIKAMAMSAASILPTMSGVATANVSMSLAPNNDTFQAQSVLGVEECVPVVTCEYPEWFSRQMRVPGTRTTLTFLRKPLMQLHCGKSFSIPDWGVQILLDGISRDAIRLAVVRTFLRLHRAAQNGALSTADAKCWEHFVRDVDYGAYCEQVAPPVWSTGTKVKTTSEGVEIAWSSSDRETLTGDFAEQMSVVDDGERFSALTSFVDFKLSALSNVAPLEHYSVVDDDLSWLS